MPLLDFTSVIFGISAVVIKIIPRFLLRHESLLFNITNLTVWLLSVVWSDVVFAAISLLPQIHWSRLRSLLNPNKTLDQRQSLSFPGRRTQAIVPGLEPFSEYRLTVSVYNKKGNGPNSDPVTFNTPEGGQLASPRLPLTKC